MIRRCLYGLKGKHAYGSSGGWSQFAEGVNPNISLKEALESPNGLFLPNPQKPGTFQLINNFGSVTGSKNQTGLKAIVDYSGEIITWFPVNSK